MKFECEKTLLASAIDGVSRAITNRAAIPVLEGIYMKAEGFNLTLTGYDMEMGITTNIECNVQVPGETVLEAKLFGSMVSRMPSGTVSVELNNEGMAIISGGVAEFEIPAMNASDYPSLPNTAAENTMTIPTSMMRELIEKTTGLITKRIKPNFKTLGPRYGKWMKQIAALVAEFSQERIAEVEAAPETVLDLGAERITVTPADFEITSEDMPGWLVASEGKLTVALDITVTEELKAEGVARELINRIQNIRKDSGFEVTDKIRVEIEQKEFVAGAIAKYAGYIASQTLAVEVKAAAQPEGGVVVDSDVDDEPIRIAVTRI